MRMDSPALPACGFAALLVACTGGTVSVGTDTGTPATIPPTDTGTAGTTDTKETAPDYTAPGAWAAGASVFETANRDGQALYGVAWWPAQAPGSEATLYGWDSWNKTGESWVDATPACDEPRPVMVHSHGYGSISWEMFWLQERLASHGWLVVASDHPGNTFYDESGAFRDLTTQRPTDVADTWTWLVGESADADSPLHGCVDPDAGYVVSGYSFGGYTAYVTGGALINADEPVDLADPAVHGVVTLAPWNAYNTLTDGTQALQVPVLTLGGELDETVGTQYLDLHGAITATPRALGSFETAGHFSYTPIYCDFGNGDGCGSDNVDLDVFTDAVGTAVLAFLGHLQGLEGALDQLPELPDELTWEVVDSAE